MENFDPHGLAIKDYFYQKEAAKLLIHTSYGTPEEMPVAHYFRLVENMSELEQMALSYCSGKVLDVGAAAGVFSLPLQENGFEVTALDNSPGCSHVLQQRGIHNVVSEDLWQYGGQTFDTILLIMNGLGLAGKLHSLPIFLNQLKNLLALGGSIIADSSDISYLYKRKPKPENKYFGEVSYRFEYKNQLGSWFDWLYIDFPTLQTIAEKANWEVKLLYEGAYDDYLVRLTPGKTL